MTYCMLANGSLSLGQLHISERLINDAKSLISNVFDNSDYFTLSGYFLMSFYFLKVGDVQRASVIFGITKGITKVMENQQPKSFIPKFIKTISSMLLLTPSKSRYK